MINFKRFPSSIICIGISLFFLLTLSLSGFFSFCDTTLYDFLLGLKIKNNPRALNAQIIPVDLNDKSEMILGSRLDDRSAFADALSVIAHSGAQAALDFIFMGDRDKDREMLEAAAQINSLVIAVIPVPQGRENVSYRELTPDEKILLRKHLWKPKEIGKGNIPKAGSFIMPFLELGEAASQLAHISIDPDDDGIYRRTPLFYAWEDGFIPSISLACALRELGISGKDIIIHHGRKIVIPLGEYGNIAIPIDSAGNVMVPFGGKWEDTVRRFSFDTLANACKDEEILNEVRNDIMRSLMFIADTSFEKKDLGPVPFEKVYLLSGLHTWVTSAILESAFGEDTFFYKMPIFVCTLIFIGLILVFFTLGLVIKDLIFNLVSAFVFLTFTILSLFLWFSAAFIPWYSACAFFIIFSWLLGFSYRFISSRQRQSALERYVPRAVAAKLVSGQRTNLVPVYKELTILFSDIKSFTTWSADKEAKAVHDFLNDYLEAMADILFAHNATVDKFMGDGILAFFGDPLEIPNHAGEAIKAAVAMQKEIKILREKWQPKVGIDLSVRIGLNTGKVIVGDLGTRRRIEYTVIGSAVNLAQRMEGLAPPGGILVAENTKIAVEKFKNLNHFDFSEKLELEVKGYDKTIAAYKVSQLLKTDV